MEAQFKSLQTEDHEFGSLFRGFYDEICRFFYEALIGDITLILILFIHVIMFSIEFGLVGYLSCGLY